MILPCYRVKNLMCEGYSRDSGSKLKAPSPEAFFCQYLRTQASQLFPAAVSLPVNESAAIWAYAIFTFWLASLGMRRTKLSLSEFPTILSKTYPRVLNYL